MCVLFTICQWEGDKIPSWGAEYGNYKVAPVGPPVTNFCIFSSHAYTHAHAWKDTLHKGKSKEGTYAVDLSAFSKMNLYQCIQFATILSMYICSYTANFCIPEVNFIKPP